MPSTATEKEMVSNLFISHYRVRTPVYIAYRVDRSSVIFNLSFDVKVIASSKLRLFFFYTQTKVIKHTKEMKLRARHM